MLIDNVVLKISAGDGGDGVVRWRREKSIMYGGPAGGDGGKGGDVYLEVIRDVNALYKYRFKKEWEADKGESGKKRSMHGSDAKDLILPIPVGSIVYNRDYDIKYECNTDGERIKILSGGRGGLGNENFKSATNRAPEEYTPGAVGQSGTFQIELRLIADIGLVGKPNAGKSSLLNTLTNAHSKIGNYAFTTLEPHLGDYYGLIIADIPGLIEGASDGKGLGTKFLKHITRTKSLLHLISAEEIDFVEEYKIIRKELEIFDKELLNKNEIIVITKTDLVTEEELKKKIKSIKKVSKNKIITLSLYDDDSIDNFKKELLKENNLN